MFASAVILWANVILCSECCNWLVDACMYIGKCLHLCRRMFDLCERMFVFVQANVCNCVSECLYLCGRIHVFV